MLRYRSIEFLGFDAGGMTVAATIDALLAVPGLLVMTVDARGALRYCNPPARERLGLAGGATTTLWDLTDADTARALLRSLEQPDFTAPAGPASLVLRTREGTSLALVATSTACRDAGGEPLLRIAGIDDPKSAADMRELERTAELLQGFIDASTEAMWCIEYTEPVDLARPESEVVRQVFENECHWSMCNRAMARLYNLPDGLDFNRQRVNAYFRRSPENEAFVRQLIEAGFHVDAAPSTDLRHDGSLAYVENSVRCHIEHGRMRRMWGTVRDMTAFRAENNRLAQREREMRAVLSALPDAVLVVDKSKRALAINPAFETTFGWNAADILGGDIDRLINLDTLDGSAGRWFAPTEQRWQTNVTTRSGGTVACDVRIAPLHDDEQRRFVLAIRPMSVAQGATPPRLGATRRHRG